MPVQKAARPVFRVGWKALRKSLIDFAEQIVEFYGGKEIGNRE